ncbi:MAG: hypothetical protein LBL13_12580 [Bacteroidales bacterium]|jgi:hypothetical protein|nr:hypothetical protein [Bacteroidales bacterium]
MNAREVNAASKYIYPADHARLYFFNEEVLKKTPNLLLTVIEKKDFILLDGQEGVIAKIKCDNISPFFLNYMQNLNMLDKDNCISDTIFVKKTGDGDKITFSWAKIKGENLYLASIAEEKDDIKYNVSSLNIHSGKSESSSIVSKLTKNKKIVIDEYSEDPNWVQCFTIDNNCHIVQGFIKKNPALQENSLFFSLGIFGGLSMLITVIILVIIAFPLVYVRSIVEIFSGMPVIGIVLSIGLILGLIFTAYQLLENILFELFIINLPY